MTNLTINLSELSTGRVTPRRKLSLCCSTSDDDSTNPTPHRSISIESGCFVDSPTPLDSPTFESLPNFAIQKQEVQPEACTKRKSVAFRRFNSMPISRMTFDSPITTTTCRGLTATQSTPQFDAGDHDSASTAHTMDLSGSTLTDISSDGDVSTSPGVGEATGSSEEGSSLVSPGKRCLFYMEESCSQDSGLECDRGDSRDSLKDLELGFEFAAPRGMPPMSRRQMRVISEDTCSPFKYSPVKDGSPSKRRNSWSVSSLDFSGEIIQPSTSEASDDDSGTAPGPADSPLKMCRLASMDEGMGDDDGFLDVMDEEVASFTTAASTAVTSLWSPKQNVKAVSSGTEAMSSLFNAPLINKASHSVEDDDTPVTRRTMSRRNLLERSQSMFARPRGLLSGKRDAPEDCSGSPSLPAIFSKRDRPQDESTPIQDSKRHRPSSMAVELPTSVAAPRPVLHRCHSDTEAIIKSALNRQADQPDLLGDYSRSHCLPTISGKHQHLKSISSETMAGVLRGDYDSDIEQAIIVDCRYPYEFNGGHIQGAKNYYTNERIVQEFMKNPIRPVDGGKRVVLIFHCEFSSERGPRLSRFLRTQDRLANKECYPNLHYPELYLLDGGYKAFWETPNTQDLCEPQAYKPMLHKDHSDDLRHFRTKSKSWAGERSRPGFRPLKF